MIASKKLKILCIHGYRQSADTFRKKTGSLRKILKSRAELTYITAPNLIEKTEEGEEQFGWWFSGENRTYKAQEYTDYCSGYTESIEIIAKSIQELGPFDGILAFSQGASLLSLICGLIEDGDTRFPCKFVILIAGFRSRQSEHAKFYEKKVKLPSLHVIGDTDQVIQREMSDKLLETYPDASVKTSGRTFCSYFFRSKENLF